MDTVQNRVSTGLKVTGAVDDASNFAISQGIRTEIRSWQAVQQSLNNSIGTVNVAIAGAESISDIVADAKKKVIEYHNATGAQQQILLNDYNALLDQIDQMANQASFNDTNLINTNGTPIPDPPDAGASHFVTSSGAPTRTHALPDFEGIVNVSYNYAGAGSTISLIYGGSTMDSVTHGFNGGGVNGSLSFNYSAEDGNDFTINTSGLGNVFYEFTYTPSANDTGEAFSALVDTKGNTTEIYSKSMLAEDIGLRPVDLSSVQSSVAQIETAETIIGQTLGYFGSKAKQLIATRNQAEGLIDSYKEGLGNIVDANMSREAARLTSMQVQTQLSTQTLSIANQRPESLLGLF
ncbi:flagellin [Nisaea nitritireducens]|uniref:flagellin n=1 Tax=Nisaea nitritireducens TaxID=568392 RepID=UPI001D00ADBE|nr:flagellin [Nisaea nitritireducens]